MQKTARAIFLITPVVLVLFCNTPQEPEQPFDRATAGMQPIPGGTFLMGSADTTEIGAQPVHEVTVDSFYMDSTEVTQLQYKDLMGFNPTITLTSVYGYYPVDSVGWFDAVLYANARSNRHHLDTVYSYSKAILKTTLTNTNKIEAIRCSTLINLTCDLRKNGYRLPTEAQWEWACRGGTKTVNYWGDSLSNDTVSQYAWFDYNYSRHLNIVAWKKPNDYGLRDMIGNVAEWCHDWYAEYPTGPTVNPVGPANGTERVLRGYTPNGDNPVGVLARSASRAKDKPGNYRSYFGFRCVLPAK